MAQDDQELGRPAAVDGALDGEVLGTSAAEWVPLDSVYLDPANVRKHSPRNLAVIEASLVKFGQRKPIVVGATDRVIQAGNGTWEAAKHLGWTRIWVAWSPLTKAEAAAFAITDNRSAEFGEWEYEALAGQLKGLQDEDWHLADLGWNDAEMKPLAAYLQPETPAFAPGTADEQGRLDQRAAVTCPECGAEFVPDKA